MQEQEATYAQSSLKASVTNQTSCGNPAQPDPGGAHAHDSESLPVPAAHGSVQPRYAHG